jgi:regulator of cell morphogenesis and NO signaling
MPTLTAEIPVGTIARELPATVKVFQRRRIDFCCGGKRSLAEACDRASAPLEEVLAELRAAAAAPGPEEEWSAAPVPALVGHIIQRYHHALHRDLPVLRDLAAKVARRHGADRPSLLAVRETVDRLSAEMASHMEKEEVVLFPMAVKLASEGWADGPAPWIADGPIAMMEHEHAEVAAMLAELRVLTAGFTPPGDACTSFRGLYEMLAELERDTIVHVHLENNVLFPRIEELALQPTT